jgi:hypothetical protein
MSEVEERVVQMKFDNSQFEAGVQQTLQSLNKLNDSIEKNTDSNKSLNGLSGIFETLKDAVLGTEDNVKSLTNAFSPLGIAGKAAIENITNKLTDFALQAAKSLTGITSMQSGFTKFAEKSKAISDLMNATGASMSDVNDVLEDLNWFTDETSYNFTDMVSTMAKLSASGEKDLNKLLSATEGIALWGAKAGANATTVSRAMYQLTQAVGRGYITYQDWLQSAVNTNMATAEIKQQLIEAAGATAIAAGANEDFNTSLKKGWLTIDVFNSVMQQYTQGISSSNYANGEFINSQNGAADATNAFSEAAFRNAQECKSWSDVVDAVADSVSTGWMTTFEYIFGDYEEAKALWTGLANLAFTVSGMLTTARNEIFAEWKDSGGRLAMLQTFVNLVNALWRILQPIGEAFNDIFGDIGGKQLASATKSVEKLSEALLITNKTILKIKTTFVVIFAVIRKLISVVAPFAKYIATLVVLISTLRTIRSLFSGGLGIGTVFNILKLLVGLGVGKYLLNATDAATKFKNALALVGGVVATVASAVADLISKIKTNRVVSAGITMLKAFLSLALTVISKINKSLQSLYNKLKSAGVLTWIQNKLRQIPSLVTSVINNVTKLLNGAKTTVEGGITSIFTKLADAAADAKNNVGGVFTSLASGAKTIKSELSKALNSTGGGLVLHANAAEIDGIDSNATKALEESAKATKDALDSNNAALAETTETAKNAAKEAEKATSGVSSLVSKWNGFLTTISGVATKIGNVLHTVYTSLTGLDWKTVLPIAVIAAYSAVMISFSKTFSGLGKSLQSLGDGIDTMFMGIRASITGFFQACAKVPTSVSKFFDSLSDSVKKNANAMMFKTVATGILALAAAVAVFAYIPFDKALKGAVVVGAITVAVIAVMVAINKLTASVDPSKLLAFSVAMVSVTASFVTFAAVLGVCALVVNTIASHCETLTDYIVRLIGPIAALGAIVGMVIAVMNTLAGCAATFAAASAGLMSAAAGIAAFSASMLLLNIALVAVKLIIVQIIADIGLIVTTISQLDKRVTITAGTMLSIVAGVMTFLVVAGLIYVGMKQLSKVTKEMATSVLSLTLSVVALSVAMAVLSNLGDKWGAAVITIAGMIAGFVVLLEIIGQNIWIEEGVKTLNDVGNGILKFAAAILVLSGALAVMTSVAEGSTWTNFAQGCVALVAGISALAVAIKIMDKCNVGKVAGGVLALVAALYALIPLIALFSIDWQAFLPGLISVGGILLTIAAAIALMGTSEVAKTAGSIAAAVVAIAAITAALLLLQNIDANQLMSSAVAIDAIVVGIDLLAYGLTSVAKDLKWSEWAKMAVVLATVSAAILGMAFVISNLEDAGIEKLEGYSLIISAFAVSVSVLSAVLAKTTKDLGGGQIAAIAVELLAFGAAVALAAAGLSLLADVPLLTIIVTIGLLTAAIVAINWAISTFSAGLVAATPFVTAIAAALGSLALVVAAVAAAFLTFALAVTSINLLIQTFVNLMPTFTANLQQLVDYLTSLSGQEASITAVASALGVMGLNLIALGAGLIVAGAGALVAGAGLVVFGAGVATAGAGLEKLGSGIEKVGKGIESFATSIGNSKTKAVNAAGSMVASIGSKFTGLGTSSKGWGSAVSSNFAAGISAGFGSVGTAAYNIAKAVWNYIHHSAGAETGPLKAGNETEWGKELVKNFSSGISGATGLVSGAMQKITGVIGGFKETFSKLGNGLGGTFIGNLWSTIKGGISSIKGAFEEGGVSGAVQQVLDNLGVDVDIEDVTSNFENLVNIDDFLANATDSAALSTDDLTSSLSSESAAADDASGSTSSAAESASELAEKQKVLTKYTNYANATMTQYMKVMGATQTIVGDTTPQEAAITAFNELAEQIYQDSLKSSDSVEDASQTAEDRAQAVMEAFNEAYESIKDNIEESLDLFTKFDNSLDSDVTADSIIKAAESQVDGVTRLSQKYAALAEKGFSQDIIGDIEEEGTGAISKINAMLKMTDEQVEQLNTHKKQVEDVSTFVTSEAMAARATAITISKLKEQAKTQEGITEEIRNTYQAYKVAQLQAEQGDEEMVEMARNLHTMLEEQCNETGVAVEDLENNLNDLSGVSAQLALNLVKIHSEASSTLQDFFDKYADMKDTITDLIDSQIDGFDALELKSETTSQTMIDNIKSQIAGLTKWQAEYTALAARGGLSDAILKDLAELGVDGYDELHAFYMMTDEQLSQYNALYEQKLSLKETASTAIATSYATAAIGGIEAYNNALTTYTASGVLMNTAIAAAQQVTNALDSNGTAGGKTAGTDTMIAIKQAMIKMIGSVTGQAEAVSEKTDDSLQSDLNTESGETVGENYLQGLLNGISDSTLRGRIESSLSSYGTMLNQLLASAMGVHSPSRITKKIGGYYMEGLQIGLDNGADGPMESVESVANQMNKSIGDALTTAVDLMNSTDDMQPTIRPIVDLSDAQNGCRLLSSMFDSAPALSASANIGPVTTPSDRMNAAISGLNGTTVTNGNTNLYIYGSQGQDVNQLADVVIKKLNNEYARRKAAWS